MGPRQGNNSYCLVVQPGGAVEECVEFEAPDMQAVLILTERHFVGQETEIYASGRSLGRFFVTAKGGYWVINPPRLEERQRVVNRTGAHRQSLCHSQRH